MFIDPAFWTVDTHFIPTTIVNVNFERRLAADVESINSTCETSSEIYWIESEWVGPTLRIAAGVCVCIESAGESNWITLRIAPRRRIIVS
jgi:hypothetical protein